MNRLRDILGNENVLYNEPMKNHTSFRTGGEAKVFVTPESEEKLVKIIKHLNESNTEFVLIGKGSNLLVSDEGYEGVVISVEKLNRIEVKGEKIIAQAGAGLMKVARKAMENALTGLEFASGIPGSVGGGVVMNAGAYGGEIKDCVEKIKYCDKDSNVYEIKGEDAKFSYRHSIFSEKDIYVLETVFSLEKGNKEEISSYMDELSKKRAQKQPLNYPSAGSAFKRPTGYFAAKLIENSNLKGFCIGDACVSEKHSGFIVNKGNAKSKDIYSLIKHCQKVVKEKQGVLIEPEIKMIGKFN